MKVIILLLATALVASAKFNDQYKITFYEDNGIHFQHGFDKQVLIYKPDQHTIAITVSGPEFKYNPILIKDAYYTQQYGYEHEFTTPFSQYDLLVQIYQNYEGSLDEVLYQKLLNQIEQYVQNGYIHKHIYNYLQALVYEHLWDSLVYQNNFKSENLIGSNEEQQGLYNYYPQYYDAYKNFYGQHPFYKNTFSYKYGYPYQYFGNFYPQNTGLYQQNKYSKTHQTPTYNWNQVFGLNVPQTQRYNQYYQQNYYPEYFQKYYPQQTGIMSEQIPYAGHQYTTYPYKRY